MLKQGQIFVFHIVRRSSGNHCFSVNPQCQVTIQWRHQPETGHRLHPKWTWWRKWRRVSDSQNSRPWRQNIFFLRFFVCNPLWRAVRSRLVKLARSISAESVLKNGVTKNMIIVSYFVTGQCKPSNHHLLLLMTSNREPIYLEIVHSPQKINIFCKNNIKPREEWLERRDFLLCW